MGSTTNFELPWPDPAVDPVRSGAVAIRALAEKVAEKMQTGRLDRIVQSGSLAATTSAGADVNVVFPVPFAIGTIPSVTVCGGEPAIPIVTAPWTTDCDHTYVNCRDVVGGAPRANQVVRVNWMAHGVARP